LLLLVLALWLPLLLLLLNVKGPPEASSRAYTAAHNSIQCQIVVTLTFTEA
jgi:hypothetical protein